MNGLQPVKIQSNEWGEILLLRVIPHNDNSWGVLDPLKGTPWGDQIVVLSGETLSHALHGYTLPLVRELGNPPETRAKRIPDEVGKCRLATGQCNMVTIHCRPGKNLPVCYEAPGSQSRLASFVAQAWMEGRYVIVVDGAEFSY